MLKMNDNFLSQEEIDALTAKSNQGEKKELLDDVTKDIIGEIGNISMSTAATTLSSILDREVLITTPRVSKASFEELIEGFQVPRVATNVEFKSGLSGNNMLLMETKDAMIIADLMMGGDGKNIKEVFSDLELSAVAEAMNQMMGSAATSMATMLGKEIDITPPDIEVWDNQENIDISKISSDDCVCKIAFDLSVQGLIQSEIMQLFTMESVEDMSQLMLGDTDGIAAIKEEERIEEIEESGEEMTEKDLERSSLTPEEGKDDKKVEVQKPSFPPLEEKSGKRKSPRNLDLIMDVPLEFNVVLGKSRKTIKEILSFSNGSIVELDKLADEPLEIYVNGKLIAYGEVVIINENFGIRITNILTKEERLENLK